MTILDCTLRDGGYYNAWDFSRGFIEDYLHAMAALPVTHVELGFRSLINDGFKGACAFCTDQFISSLAVPDNLAIGVMVNAAELLKHPDGKLAALNKLFAPATESPVSLVRIACHFHEIEDALDVCDRLKQQGYSVCVNLMQISDRSPEEIETVGRLASGHDLDMLYFADSLGGLVPDRIGDIVKSFRVHWTGALGIHAHDNLGSALANTMQANQKGVEWLDSTVMGMGRGPGNTKTEYLAIELAGLCATTVDVLPLLAIIRKHFKPLHDRFTWGTNTYYYLAGKYGIHPTYIQEMLTDTRYNDEDIITVIQHLKKVGGKRYKSEELETGRYFYQGSAQGSWSPETVLRGREILILGAGPGAVTHRLALEQYIRTNRPVVVALNAQETVEEGLVDLRAACHPIRLLADCAHYTRINQPLLTPASILPEDVLQSLSSTRLLDYGLTVRENSFEFETTHCVIPSPLVLGYALAAATSGNAARILLAGFDGYEVDDPRYAEVDALFRLFMSAQGTPPLAAITPTKYKIPSLSVYAL